MKVVRFSVALVALLLGGAAFAQGTGADAPRPPPARADSAAAQRLDRPVRVRASHRVDVIAPGERVETIIDRMRSTRPATPPADHALSIVAYFDYLADHFVFCDFGQRPAPLPA